MKAFQRILAVLLCLVMSLGMISMVASAATTDTIDTTAKGSLTIHKYEYNRPQGETATNGTGASTDTVPSGAKGLNGVTFKITYVTGVDYYKYNDATSLDVDKAKTMITANSTSYTETTKKVNGVDGIIEKELPLGIYLVQEISAPSQITAPVADFLVSIPMTDSTGDGWLYDVHVFPKNGSTYAPVTLKKVGVQENFDENADNDTVPLGGAVFTLEEYENNAWTPVTANDKGQPLNLTTADGTGLITVSELAPGTYRFTETNAPDNYIMDGTIHYQFTIGTDGKVYYDGQATNDVVIVTTKTTEVTTKAPIVVTNYKPNAKKEITDGQDITMVGKKVSYKVTVAVPENIIKLDKFEVTDAPTGLKVDLSSIKVNNVAVTEKTYWNDVTANGNGGFKLEFVPANMTDVAGETIEITYQAEITSDAIDNNKATNDVTLTYNDVIDSESEKTIDPPGTETKLFDVTITKYKDSVNPANKLNDVKFVLYKDSVADANKIKVVSQGNGNYNVADTDDGVAEDAYTMTTANGGNLKISGLANGTYYLVETATVAGYNLLKEPVEITVNNADIDAGTINVINKAGFQLPQTGGIGTLMFIIIGGVLMAGGICLIVPNKKRAI